MVWLYKNITKEVNRLVQEWLGFTSIYCDDESIYSRLEIAINLRVAVYQLRFYFFAIRHTCLSHIMRLHVTSKSQF